MSFCCGGEEEVKTDMDAKQLKANRGRTAAEAAQWDRVLCITATKVSNITATDMRAKTNEAGLATGIKHTCDPYLKVKLQEGFAEPHQAKTRTIEDSLNPVFEESFRILIHRNIKSFQMELWDNDVGFDDSLGKLEYQLQDPFEETNSTRNFERNGKTMGSLALTYYTVSLKEAAKIYKQLKSTEGDVANLQASLVKMKFDDEQDEETKAKMAAEMKELEEKAEAARAQAEKEAAELQEKIAQAEEEAEKRRQELEAEKADQESKDAEAAAEKERLAAEQAELEASLANSQNEAENELTQLRIQVNNITSERNQAQQQASQKNQECMNLQSQLAQKNREIAELMARCSQAEAQRGLKGVASDAKGAASNMKFW